jgi:SagB-type dehydrogenase family enzyme
MIERFTLCNSALRLMGPNSGMPGNDARQLAKLAEEYGPFYRFTERLSIDDTRTRKSRRNYGETRLCLDLLTDFLSLSLFCKDDAHRRSYPAAGAIYSNHVYLVARNILGLRDGVYFVRWIDRAVERIGEADPSFFTEGLDQENKTAIDCVLLLVADIRFSKAKYHDRAIRFALVEAGALMQTMYLAGERVHIGVCGLGAVADGFALRLCQRDRTRDVFLAAALSLAAISPSLDEK